MHKHFPTCTDIRHCFARVKNRCLILSETYENEDRLCPFCKEYRDDECRKEKNTQAVHLAEKKD